MASIDFDFRLDLGLFAAATEAAFPVALARGGEAVRAVAVARTPGSPPGTGHLRGSAGVTVHGTGASTVAEIKYEGPYAAFQNRGMRADGTHVIRHRPAGGQTGFLTETMVDQRQTVLDIIAATIRDLA